MTCEHPPCSVSGCITCKSCGYVRIECPISSSSLRVIRCTNPNCSLKPEPLPLKLRPKELEDVRNFKCLACRLSCSVCGTNDEGRFSPSVLHDISDTRRQIWCREHSNPACTNPACKTCKSCRNAKKPCTRTYCTEEPEPLPVSKRPQTPEDLLTFECGLCAGTKKKLYRCVACNTDKSAEAFSTTDVKAHEKKPGNKKLLCRDCGANGCTARDTQLYTCSVCTRKLGRKKFPVVSLENFQRGHQRTVQCLECKKLVLTV